MGGWGRDPLNCRGFWTLGSSGSVQNVNRHRDRGGWGQDPRNHHLFWTLASSWNANSHRDRGGWDRNPGNCEGV